MTQPSAPKSAPTDDAEFAQAESSLAAADSFETFEQAVALIEGLSRRGHAGGSATLATLEAVGAGRPRDWGKALDYLVEAARLGSDAAGAQLRLLASVSSHGDDLADDWSHLRAQISIERLLEAPQPVPMSERPRLRVFEQFAHPLECGWVIERQRPRLAPAMVWDERTNSPKRDSSRSNSVVELGLVQSDVVTALLRARISAATRLPEFIFEVPQVMHYAPGEEFTPHHDFLDAMKPGHAADLASRGQRMGTFLIFLNDDFEGGETEFPSAGIRHRARAGDALFFANITPDGQPDPLTLHAGRPPTKGEKWIVSQWIRDRPPIEAQPPRTS